MSPDQMRAKLSVLYKGTWGDRVYSMPDNQVYAIWNRHLRNEQKKKEKA